MSDHTVQRIRNFSTGSITLTIVNSQCTDEVSSEKKNHKEVYYLVMVSFSERNQMIQIYIYMHRYMNTIKVLR